jgi:hypothetical protein
MQIFDGDTLSRLDIGSSRPYDLDRDEWKIRLMEELPDPDIPWFSFPTEDEFSEDLEDGTPYDMGYKVDEAYDD